jgi:hypothetical protein
LIAWKFHVALQGAAQKWKMGLMRQKQQMPPGGPNSTEISIMSPITTRPADEWILFAPSVFFFTTNPNGTQAKC